MITDRNRIYDGFTSLEAGVDAGRRADLLDPTQAFSAENLVFRGGHPTTRPGIRALDLSFPNLVGSEVIFKRAILQCALGYSAPNGEEFIMALVSGFLFKILPGPLSASVELISIAGDYTDIDRPADTIAYMCQAEKFLIIQDGKSKPIIYDGSTARRSMVDDPDSPEVPVGTFMAYGMGRLVVAVNKRNVAFGDLLGSHDDPDPADSIVKFTERTFLAEGFDASISDDITALQFFPQLDTSTGNGQLLAFTKRGADSFDLSIERINWKTQRFQQIALKTTGVVGHRTVSIVNEDLWFRAEDGWRSFRQSRSEPLGWSHIPLSTNVRQYLDNDTPELLKYGSSIYFDNRIIGTCNPYPNVVPEAYIKGRPYHNGLVVVDFDILSSFGTKYRPAWNGRWKSASNLRVTQLLTHSIHGVERAFAFGITSDGDNQLYEFTTSDFDDYDGEIPWELQSRSFDFSKTTQSSTPFNENELYGGDIWMHGSRHQTPVTVEYKPDDYQSWVPWSSFTIRPGVVGQLGAITPGGVPTAKAGFIPRFTLAKPADDCDSDNSKRLLRRGFKFQTKISGSGHITIDRFRVQAQKLVEKATA